MPSDCRAVARGIAWRIWGAYSCMTGVWRPSSMLPSSPCNTALLPESPARVEQVHTVNKCRGGKKGNHAKG